jgi:hypothetical protein
MENVGQSMELEEIEVELDDTLTVNPTPGLLSLVPLNIH